jgi:hypothetical protein
MTVIGLLRRKAELSISGTVHIWNSAQTRDHSAWVCAIIIAAAPGRANEGGGMKDYDWTLTRPLLTLENSQSAAPVRTTR